MDLLVTALDVVAAVAIAAGLVLAALAVRRRLLLRGDGTIDCSLRQPGGRRGWALGVGRYADDELQWFRVFSFALRPSCLLCRRELAVRNRRRPAGPEAFALAAGVVVVECDSACGPVELAMSEPALTGFLAWLESAPPGTHLRT